MNQDQMIQTNMGAMPLRDYLEIKALQCGFDSYADMQVAGYYINLENQDQTADPE